MPANFYRIIAAGIGVGVVSLFFLGEFSDLGFRFSRIAVWRNPEAYMDKGGYQVMQGCMQLVPVVYLVRD